jgi:hypothetical protein
MDFRVSGLTKNLSNSTNTQRYEMSCHHLCQSFFSFKHLQRQLCGHPLAIGGCGNKDHIFQLNTSIDNVRGDLGMGSGWGTVIGLENKMCADRKWVSG